MRSVITAKIDDGVLHVVRMDMHDIGLIGGSITGTGVMADTVIEGQILGHPGGIGAYLLNKKQTVPVTTMRFEPRLSVSEDINV